MKSYKGETHKKSGKNDGHKPQDDRHKGDKKMPPKFENFEGKPID